MNAADPQKATVENLPSPELQPGLVEALTAAYATLLRRQRTASAAYVRWTAAHSRAHEFAWFEGGNETLLTKGGNVVIEKECPVHSSIQKMMATMELNPYERELQYGYPYVIGQSNGKSFRAPLLTMPVVINPDGGRLVISATEDLVRFNSLPFRSDFDTGAQELAIARLIEQTPEFPLTCGSLREFCEAIARELGVRIAARLDGVLNAAPAQPQSQMRLTLVDNAACFIAPKTSYFLVSDLEDIAQAGASAVASTALGWLVGKRPSEPTSDRFEDRRKLFYPFPSNPSQRRVAHLVDDPKTRITVVQGPPGSGKSLTIANLACHLVASGKRVLVTSQKDKALQVVDEMLKGLELAQLPMTLLRQDRESKKQLRERLESIQKERSSQETRQAVESEMGLHEKAVETHEINTVLLTRSLKAEHALETAAAGVKNASGRFARLMSKWKFRRTLRRAERDARQRSDELGSALRETRGRLQQVALSLLDKAAQHRTSTATKAERNQLREFAKLLGRNQANFKNYPVFDRLKADSERCIMLLKILPCWIMTPDDVARLFPCAPGLFDVVIIDEASQCDLPSMTPVLFRAKQAVIAGDSKQMQAQRFAFTANQVSAQAWAEHGLDRLDPDKWLDPAKIDLLQLASIRMDEEAFLDEHYRSLPAIIEFSNQRWYGGRLRLMRDQDDKQFGDPDSPVINLHRVRGSVTPGTQENEIEARELVTHLRQMLRHPGYSEASFGVVCLFEEQMRLVNDLVAEQIPDELRGSHDLVVVNPDGFQGDERDVILYSLSFDAAGMAQQALSARQADREHIQGMLNVAFTRARDEIHIFHSADVSDFGMTSGSGAIRDWLEYCDQHCNGRSATTAGAEIQLAKAQSEFEQQVMASLVSKGVKVTSQYPSCGFFVDVVAELNDSRLAIECDGEIWHLDEHGELKQEDIERQEILERAGWKVIRIPYRSWRENPEAQVHRILDEFNNSEPLTTPEVTQTPEDAQVSAIAVDRFEDALLKTLKLGLCSRDEVFKASRQLLGYSRMGPQIRVSLGEALERVVKKGFVRVEDDEAFFSNEAARNARYEVKTIVPPSYTMPRRRKYRRYRRW